MEQNAIVSLKDVYVEFDSEVILNKINLDIKDKEFVTLLGPSGCGKTTTLRVIGGFLNPDGGDVYFEGKRINDLPPNKRNVNTVFQKYALFPHLNVYENIAFGLKLKKMKKPEIDKLVKEMLAIVDLKGYEKRRVNQLSGGQQQRVAIARAVIKGARILFCDEATGSLDEENSKKVVNLLHNLKYIFGMTVLFTTHNKQIAQTADRILTIKNGMIFGDVANKKPISADEMVWC